MRNLQNYILITGATGLLGAYLLRDLLSRGLPCAVLARSNRMESAAQRIESILVRMEREWGTSLPRPVVLEGTLTENFGLDSEKMDWVRRHCGRLLHNAASLVFERDPKTDEPYRSNVTGTEHAVEFALRCGIPQFHHVSTAYVCGLRGGVCRESELDVGQDWGNDYEKAKVVAEKTVRAASFAEAPTFYRPAIITGDSVTGYTSTYHGFYTPLKVAASLVADQAFRGSADDILHLLGMNGGEHKNFVPVEWISQVIVSLLTRPESIGGTFHLTPKNRVTVGQMYAVFTEAMKRFGERHAETKPKAETAKSLSPEVLGGLMTSFRDQMKVYRSYWRDDPTFDAAATDAALPDLPCPTMSEEVLMRLSMFALEANFGWPKAQPIRPPFFVRDLLPVSPNFRAPALSSATDGTRTTAVSFTGAGGGEWTVTTRNGRLLSAEEGRAADADVCVKLAAGTFGALRNGTLSPRQAVDSGAAVQETVSSNADGSETADFLTALASAKGEE